MVEDALMAWVSSSQGSAKSIMLSALAQPCRPQCCESHLPVIDVASKKTWPESDVARQSGRKAGAIHITPTRLDLHLAPPDLRRSMTLASTACKSCVQGDGICEVLMRDEGHWVILDASMVILTFWATRLMTGVAYGLSRKLKFFGT